MKKWRTFLAGLISDLTAPPILSIPVYTLLGLYDQAQQGSNFFSLLTSLFFAITFASTLPAAFIFFQFRHHKVSGLHIPVREQRNLPYIFIIVSNIIGFIFISWLSGTGVLAGALLANALGGIIVTFINLYWKISAHAFGVTAPLSILVLLFGWIMWPFALLVPVVGWARVYLHAHTLGQIVAGFLLGFALTYLQFVFIFQPLGWFK